MDALPALLAEMESGRSAFTLPSFRNAIVLMVGWVLTRGRRGAGDDRCCAPPAFQSHAPRRGADRTAGAEQAQARSPAGARTSAPQAGGARQECARAVADVSAELYGKRRPVRYKMVDAQWYRACGGRLVRSVVVRIDEGNLDIRVFLCTEVAARRPAAG
jgi:hypothetical protein